MTTSVNLSRRGRQSEGRMEVAFLRGASGGAGQNAGVKPWLLPLLLASVALAGGVQVPTLPRLSLNAGTVGRVADIRVVGRVPRGDAPQFFFPSHVRAVLNRPGQHWGLGYDVELPPAYVAVYPVAGLLAQYPEQAQYPERGEPWDARTQIEKLRALNRGGLNEVKEPLPYLPLWNAFQVTAGAVRTVQTPTLRGVRYLTVLSQEDGVRFPREAVFYTFQGLSRDGRFYVTAQVPYAPATLPTRDELDRTRSHVVARYSGPVGGGSTQDAYRADLTRKLNAEDGASGVRDLDALVRSIRLS